MSSLCNAFDEVKFNFSLSIQKEIGNKEFSRGVKFSYILSCIYCIVRCELKKTIFLGRKMSFTKHFLRWEAKY